MQMKYFPEEKNCGETKPAQNTDINRLFLIDVIQATQTLRDCQR